MGRPGRLPLRSARGSPCEVTGGGAAGGAGGRGALKSGLLPSRHICVFSESRPRGHRVCHPVMKETSQGRGAGTINSSEPRGSAGRRAPRPQTAPALRPPPPSLGPRRRGRSSLTRAGQALAPAPGRGPSRTPASAPAPHTLRGLPLDKGLAVGAVGRGRERLPLLPGRRPDALRGVGGREAGEEATGEARGVPTSGSAGVRELPPRAQSRPHPGGLRNPAFGVSQ